MWAFMSIVNVIWFLSGVVMVVTFFPMILIMFGEILLKINEPIQKLIVFLFWKTIEGIAWIWKNVIVWIWINVIVLIG